ncbi:MAG: hypothetical protein LBF32_03985 [Streptococcaceae bacterium]|jgi:hypothetical protein|nr:hypothetical protein [Streptococcaceae bacterium]
MKLKKSVLFLAAVTSLGGVIALGERVHADLPDAILAQLSPAQKVQYEKHKAHFTPVKTSAMEEVIIRVVEKGRIGEVPLSAFDTYAEKLEAQTDEFVRQNIDQVDVFVDQVIANKDNGSISVLDDILEVRYLYRLLNPNSPFKIHHITDNWQEVEKLKAAGWIYEGIVGLYNGRGDGAPIYRLYNQNSPWGEHLITPDWNEVQYLINASKGAWKLEGGNETVDKGETRMVAFYVPNIRIGREEVMQRGPVFGAVYRIYNKLNGGEHFYTMNWNEVLQAEKLGWVYEGIVWLYK